MVNSILNLRFKAFPQNSERGQGDPNEEPYLTITGTGLAGDSADVGLEVFQTYLDSNKNDGEPKLKPFADVVVSRGELDALQQLRVIFAPGMSDTILAALRSGTDDGSEDADADANADNGNGGEGEELGHTLAELFEHVRRLYNGMEQEYANDAISQAEDAGASVRATRSRTATGTKPPPAPKVLHSTSFVVMQIYAATSAIFSSGKEYFADGFIGKGSNVVKEMAAGFDRAHTNGLFRSLPLAAAGIQIDSN